MRKDRYTVEALASMLEFEFYSEGPKGKFKKQINHVPFDEDSRIYNLAEITADFVIYGFCESAWEISEPGKGYGAFLIKKRRFGV
jgi:hypothetical protein